MKHHKPQPKSQNNSSAHTTNTNNVSVIIFWIVSVGTALFLAVAFFYWTIVPYMQSSEYLSDIRQAFSTGDYTVLTSDQFIFDPDSNVEGILRADFIREVTGLYNNGQLTTPTPLLDKAISEMEDYTSNHADYYTYILALANGYAVKSQVTNDPSLFVTAENYYKKDMDVIKGRQDIIYTYALNLIKRKRTDEGLQLLKDTIAQNPGVFASNYQLAEAYMIIGDSYYGDALAQFEIALNHDVDVNPDFTKQAYQEFLRYYYKQNDFDNFYTVINRLSQLDPTQQYAYRGVMDSMQKNHKIPDLQIEAKK